jgi:hypothetical protein
MKDELRWVLDLQLFASEDDNEDDEDDKEDDKEPKKKQTKKPASNADKGGKPEWADQLLTMMKQIAGDGNGTPQGKQTQEVPTPKPHKDKKPTEDKQDSKESPSSEPKTTKSFLRWFLG